MTSAVEVGCLAGTSAGDVPSGPQSAEAGECGLRAGESLKFEFSLGYEAEELRAEPIYIVFSDGRTGIASW